MSERKPVVWRGREIPEAALEPVETLRPGCSPVAVLDTTTGKIRAYGFVCGCTPRFSTEFEEKL